VILQATAAADSNFSGWGGACAGAIGNTCTVSMTQAQSVSATFAIKSYTLTVSVGGTGSGAVTGTGINCPGDCTQTFTHGTAVLLTASAAADSNFSGWGGACAGAIGNTCTVSMTSARSASATFTLIPSYTVTLNKAGTGTGTVTSAPSGISCGPGCNSDSGTFLQGTNVTLTASAAGGSVFGGWGNCPSPSGTTCNINNISQSRTITATFTPTYSLTVNSGTGDGSYTAGTVVAIAADTPPSGEVFDQWTGDTGFVTDVNDPTTTVTMPASNVTVTATYVPEPTTTTTTTEATTTTSAGAGAAQAVMPVPPLPLLGLLVPLGSLLAAFVRNVRRSGRR
jgi:hypothetical protein